MMTTASSGASSSGADHSTTAAGSSSGDGGGEVRPEATVARTAHLGDQRQMPPVLRTTSVPAPRSGIHLPLGVEVEAGKLPCEVSAAEHPWDAAWRAEIAQAKKGHKDGWYGKTYPSGTGKLKVSNSFCFEEIEEYAQEQYKERRPLSGLIHTAVNQIPYESIEDYVSTCRMATELPTSKFM